MDTGAGWENFRMWSLIKMGGHDGRLSNKLEIAGKTYKMNAGAPFAHQSNSSSSSWCRPLLPPISSVWDVAGLNLCLIMPPNVMVLYIKPVDGVVVYGNLFSSFLSSLADRRRRILNDIEIIIRIIDSVWDVAGLNLWPSTPPNVMVLYIKPVNGVVYGNLFSSFFLSSLTDSSRRISNDIEIIIRVNRPHGRLFLCARRSSKKSDSRGIGRHLLIVLWNEVEGFKARGHVMKKSECGAKLRCYHVALPLIMLLHGCA